MGKGPFGGQETQASLPLPRVWRDSGGLERALSQGRLSAINTGSLTPPALTSPPVRALEDRAATGSQGQDGRNWIFALVPGLALG